MKSSCKCQVQGLLSKTILKYAFKIGKQHRSHLMIIDLRYKKVLTPQGNLLTAQRTLAFFRM